MAKVIFGDRLKKGNPFEKFANRVCLFRQKRNTLRHFREPKAFRLYVGHNEKLYHPRTAPGVVACRGRAVRMHTECRKHTVLLSKQATNSLPTRHRGLPAADKHQSASGHYGRCDVQIGGPIYAHRPRLTCSLSFRPPPARAPRMTRARPRRTCNLSRRTKEKSFGGIFSKFTAGRWRRRVGLDDGARPRTHYYNAC